MTIRRMPYLNPMMRWRWDAAGAYGYATTKRGAARAARAHQMAVIGSSGAEA